MYSAHLRMHATFTSTEISQSRTAP